MRDQFQESLPRLTKVESALFLHLKLVKHVGFILAMKFFSKILLIVLMISLAACSGGTSSTTPTTEVTPTLSQPGINTTQAPDVNQTVRRYLDAWENEDYALMYGMLTPLSRDAITEE